MKKTNYIIANWKMNGSWAANAELFKAIKEFTPLHQASSPHTEVIICPPHPYLVQAKGLLNQSAVAFGAQDVSEQKSGAYTGDVSASMLVDLEAQYAIIGHSERRQFQHETNQQIANKLARLLEANIKPIICIGEALQTRQEGKTLAWVDQQLEPIISLLQAQKNNIVAAKAETKAEAEMPILIAYEPIWAIGTGLTPTLDEVQAVCAHIQQKLAPLNMQHFVLYGGSVKASNAKDLLSLEEVDGFLVGGASLIAEEFKAIIGSVL